MPGDACLCHGLGYCKKKGGRGIFSPTEININKGKLKLFEAVSESHVILKYLARPHNVYQNPYNQFTIIFNNDLLPASRAQPLQSA